MKGKKKRPSNPASFGNALLFFVAAISMMYSSCCSAATFSVINTNDSGAGSLRQAITSANSGAGLDTIQFSISGNGPYVIRPLTALPAITEAVVISATNQTGYSNRPVVELRGSSAGSTANGLYIQAGGCTVRGLAINRFSLSGIFIESSASNNIIQGNFIGTDPTGKIAYGNGEGGITIYQSPNNLIGGTNIFQRNLISGTNFAGIYIIDPPSTNNQIKGNYIGTDIAGTNALGRQTNGVFIYSAPANIIGGTTAAERNIISGNYGTGILIANAEASNNVIRGNFIGLSVSGTARLGNREDGITIVDAPRNFVGGTNAGASNVISANLERGVQIIGVGATNNTIQGNLIGTDVTGRIRLGNLTNGIAIAGAADNLIGGTVPQARNVIAANLDAGIYLTSDDTKRTRIEGNYIGVDITGTNAMGNSFNGVFIDSGSSNIIGGNVSGAGNVISGNTNNGIFLAETSFGNLICGNYIGVDATGRRERSNELSGVWIESSNNVVGGALAAQRNVISGNGVDGVTLAGEGSTGNRILGNYIGLDMTGTNGLGNAYAGVGIFEARNNFVGGAAAGEGNVISDNGDAGLDVIGTNTTGNVIAGNRIGTDFTGTKAIGNTYEGLYLLIAATNQIGGPTAAHGNLVSGNHGRGIWLTNSSYNIIANNFIGTRADGTNALANVFHGVELDSNSHDNIVGGTGAGNRIAFAPSPYTGVRVRPGATNNAILNNSIFFNGALGIDLGNAGFDAPDGCDSDGGANFQQNFPVLAVGAGGSMTAIKGVLNSRPNTTYRVQFFANPSCDSTGYGEGQTFLGEASVTTGAFCTNSFLAALNVAVTPGNVITATATDPKGNTSEFSPCAAVVPTPQLKISTTNTTQLALAWPTNATAAFKLKQTDSLKPPVAWSDVTNSASMSSGQNFVLLSRSVTNRFFTLVFE